MDYLKRLETRHWIEVVVVTKRNLPSLRSSVSMARWKDKRPSKLNFPQLERELEVELLFIKTT